MQCDRFIDNTNICPSSFVQAAERDHYSNAIGEIMSGFHRTYSKLSTGLKHQA